MRRGGPAERPSLHPSKLQCNLPFWRYTGQAFLGLAEGDVERGFASRLKSGVILFRSTETLTYSCQIPGYAVNTTL